MGQFGFFDLTRRYAGLDAKDDSLGDRGGGSMGILPAQTEDGADLMARSSSTSCPTSRSSTSPLRSRRQMDNRPGLCRTQRNWRQIAARQADRRGRLDPQAKKTHEPAAAAKVVFLLITGKIGAPAAPAP
jgi:hypothetical protein